jgi:hypothetical protein
MDQPVSQEIDFLLAHEYELSPNDPRSIGRAVAQFLSDSVLFASGTSSDPLGGD